MKPSAEMKCLREELAQLRASSEKCASKLLDAETSLFNVKRELAQEKATHEKCMAELTKVSRERNHLKADLSTITAELLELRKAVCDHWMKKGKTQ